MQTLIPVGLGIPKGGSCPDCLFCFRSDELVAKAPMELPAMIQRADIHLIYVPLVLLGDLQNGNYYNFLDGYSETTGAFVQDKPRISSEVSLNCDITDTAIELYHGLFVAVYERQDNTSITGNVVQLLDIKRHGAFRLKLRDFEKKIPVLFDDGYAYYTGIDYEIDDETTEKIGVRKLAKNQIISHLGTFNMLSETKTKGKANLSMLPYSLGYEILGDKTPSVVSSSALVRYDGCSMGGLMTFSAPQIKSISLVARDDNLRQFDICKYINDGYLSFVNTRLSGDILLYYTRYMTLNIAGADMLGDLTIRHAGKFKGEALITLKDIPNCRVLNFGGKPLTSFTLEITDMVLDELTVPPCDELTLRLWGTTSVRKLNFSTVTRKMLVVQLGSSTVGSVAYMGDTTTYPAESCIYQPGSNPAPVFENASDSVIMTKIKESNSSD